MQKAGIIKPGCTVVSAAQQPEAKQVILDAAERCDCEVHFAEPEKIVKKERGLLRQVFDYKDRTDVEISLSGEYQFDNAALALEILGRLSCERLFDSGGSDSGRISVYRMAGKIFRHCKESTVSHGRSP